MSGYAVTLRYLAAALFAMTVTYGLFFAMFQLTKGGGSGTLLPSYDALRLDFIRLKPPAEEAPERKRYLPPKPDLTSKPARPALPQQKIRSSLQSAALPLRLPDLPRVRGDLDIGAIGSGNVTPVFRVQPLYPMSAQRRGIEGWVEVEFAIDKNGHVTNPQIIDSQPKKIFDRAVLRAISRWRYQPQMFDGVPVMRDGMRVLINFELE